MMLAWPVIAVVAATIFFTLFVRVKDIPAPDPVSPTRHLDERKAAIYENLRDLQFEYRLGKLSDDDYQQAKLGLQKELAGVMAEINRINAGGEPAKAAESPYVAEPAKTKAASAPKAKTEALAETACPHCGAKFATPMKFCGECGKAMES